MKPVRVLLVFIVVFSSSFGARYEDTDEDSGGPSSEFRPAGYEWTMDDIGYSRGRLRHLRTLQKRSLAEQIKGNPLIKDKDDEKFFKALPGVLRKFEKDLEKTLLSSKLSGVVSGRIKTVTSLINRMKDRGFTDYRDITDIVGLRVTLQTLDDISNFKRAYMKTFNTNITEIRCYGVCGPVVKIYDSRMKKVWPWREGGYRRLHLKVAVAELRTDAEIQIGTPYMTLWAEWSHAVIYKGPKKLKNNPRVKTYSQKLSEYYMMLDNIRNRMAPQCPKPLKKTKGEAIFSPKDWKTFGSPPDACNFWNDLRVDMP